MKVRPELRFGNPVGATGIQGTSSIHPIKGEGRKERGEGVEDKKRSLRNSREEEALGN